MINIFSDYIFDGRKFLEDCALTIHESGKILKVHAQGEYDKNLFQYYPGILTPGFINSHCHLELSHLKGLLDSGTGLISFLHSVVSQRETSQELIDTSILAADLEMYNNGIVAIGDISNKKDTIKVKSQSKIKYYNFIECFDFHQGDKAESFFEPYNEVYTAYGNLAKSFVPHASYSVSPQLMKLIDINNQDTSILSIHNQEVIDEDLLFLNKGGSFESFFSQFGFSLSHFNPTGKNSVYYVMDNLNSKRQTLFVHNTWMSHLDMQAVIQWNHNSYFVTCPNANLYIENRLPDYSQFIKNHEHICIGTDSYSSNWSLSILDEIKTILKYCSTLTLEQTLQWASINGAKALRMDETLGSIEVNKIPGINWIQDVKSLNSQIVLGNKAQVKKII